MNKRDHSRLLDFYGSRKEKHGLGSPLTLSWNNSNTQNIRFKVLKQISPKLENSTVLDLGCGFGDLLDSLEEDFNIQKYIGIDIEKDFIEYARKERGSEDVEFLEADFLNMELPKVDFVLISGSLNFKIDNAKQIYLDLIRKSFETCEVGVGFNMLDSRYHIDDDDFVTYDPQEVFQFCLELTPEAELVRGYLSYDFTIFMYK